VIISFPDHPSANYSCSGSPLNVLEWQHGDGGLSERQAFSAHPRFGPHFASSRTLPDEAEALAR